MSDERVVTMGELLEFSAICDAIANCGFTVDEAVMAMSRLGMIDIFDTAQASGVFDEDGNEIEPFEEE